MKKNIKTILLIVSLLSLVACSKKPAEDTMNSLPTLLPNPFVEQTSSEAGTEGSVSNPNALFSYRRQPIAGFENCSHDNRDCYINFSGDPIEVTFGLGDNGNSDGIELGLAIFIDGAIQPHQVIKSTQSSEGLRPVDELQYLSSHRMKTNEHIEVTIRFNPVTGKKGQTLSFNQMVMLYPSYLPDSPDQYFGIMHDAHPYDYGTVRFLEDAPTQVQSPVVQVESQPIPESMKMVSEDNPTGRVQTPFYYFNDGSRDGIAKVILKDGKANLRIQIGGGVEANYRVTIFVNHKPVMVEGNESFIIKSVYDQIVTYNFVLDVQDLPRFNSLYATILPTGDGYLLNPESGNKNTSILLINEDAPWSGEASQTSTTGDNTTVISSNFSQDGLQDLSSGLIGSHISSGDILHLSNMSDSIVFLALGEKLLLIDTSSGEILKENLSGFPSPGLLSFYKLQDGIAISVIDVLANKALIRLFDSNLQETKTVNPASLLGIEEVFSEHCAVSASGMMIACLDNSFTSIVVADIDSGTRLKTFDISNEIGNRSFRINSLAFGGDDKFLAFIGFDAAEASTHKTSYGIIDLDQNRIIFTNSKNNLNEYLFQPTSSHFLFVERKGVFDMSDGNVVLFDLTRQEERLIPFTHDSSDGRESFTVTISPSGHYLTGFEYHYGDIVDERFTCTKYVLRIYDMRTLEIVKEIALEGGFTWMPKVSFTANEDAVLIAFSEASKDFQIRLLKYALP